MALFYIEIALEYDREKHKVSTRLVSYVIHEQLMKQRTRSDGAGKVGNSSGSPCFGNGM